MPQPVPITGEIAVFRNTSLTGEDRAPIRYFTVCQQSNREQTTKLKPLFMPIRIIFSIYLTAGIYTVNLVGSVKGSLTATTNGVLAVGLLNEAEDVACHRRHLLHQRHMGIFGG